MAGKKISELQRLTEISGQELLPVAVDGQNYSILTSLLQGGGATKLNDYMYDVSLLMGKMAVRGTKGTSKSTNPYGNGYYNTDGEYVEGSTNTLVDTVLVDPNKVYHFDVGAVDQPALTNPAILVLFDEDDSVIESVPLTAAGFRDRYLVFTSSVKKYGVTYMVLPTVQPQPSVYNETYEIGDVNTALNEVNAKSDSMRDDFNNYISDVTDLFGKMAYRDGVGTDLKNPISGSYFHINTGVLSPDPNYSYQYIEVDSSKMYYLNIPFSGSVVAQLCLYDKSGNLIKDYQKTIEGYFIFKGVSKIGVSSYTQGVSLMKIQSFDISDITTVINTQQGNGALYVAAGAVYNEKTGFYELNGLTDITEEQMREIYLQTHHVTRQTSFVASFANTSGIRTNYALKVSGGYLQINIHAMFSGCTDLEVAALNGDVDGLVYPVNAHYLFRGCRKLKKVIGIILMDIVNSSTKYEMMFGECFALISVRLRGIKYDISFSNSPLLNLESLQYLITNAANTSAITVTVHADVYAKIQDETQTEWHALIASAQEKQITFATA